MQKKIAMGAAISRSNIGSSNISNGEDSSSAEVNQSYHLTTLIYEDNEKLLCCVLSIMMKITN